MFVMRVMNFWWPLLENHPKAPRLNYWLTWNQTFAKICIFAICQLYFISDKIRVHISFRNKHLATEHKGETKYIQVNQLDWLKIPRLLQSDKQWGICKNICWADSEVLCFCREASNFEEWNCCCTLFFISVLVKFSSFKNVLWFVGCKLGRQCNVAFHISRSKF